MSEEKSISTPAVLRSIVIGLLVALAIAAGFALHERNTARRLSASNEAITAALKNTESQVQALTDKVNLLAAPPAPATVMVVKPDASKHKTVHRRPKDDPRWKKVQSQLDDQGRQIEATRQDLKGARTELQGSIARTHEELVLLQKRGERNYYEFDLDKNKRFEAKGPLGLRLKKANTKQQYADLELMVDDVKVAQKHVNLYQPVVFYAAEGGQAVELVINRITKNHIHGYVSEPKYRRSELASISSANESGTASQAAPAQNTSSARRKLPLPQ
ncbi:MAG: hypothetical protein ACE14M_03495 [Terriglobales bacterium]